MVDAIYDDRMENYHHGGQRRKGSSEDIGEPRDDGLVNKAGGWHRKP